MAILVIVVVLVVCFLLYSKVYRNHTFEGIDYDCYFEDTEVYVGESITFIEEVTNSKYMPVTWLKAELTTSKYLNFSEKCSSVTYKSRFVSSCYAIEGNKSVKREWKLTSSKRGVFSIDGVVLNTCDIFGNNEVSKPVEGISTRVVVLPLEVDTPKLDVSINGIVGDVETQRNLLTDPFAMRGVREYTGHERLNRIHWKASAKQSQLMAIEEGYTAEVNVVVYLYLQENCEETLAEKSLSTACTVAVRLSEKNIPTRLDTNCGSSTTTSFGNGHALNIKRYCAELELTPSTFEVPTMESGDSSLLVVVTPLKNRELFKESPNCRVVYVRL
jgi:hypothetical protein